MANMPRRRPLDMLGEMGDPAGPEAAMPVGGLSMGAPTGVGAEDPAALGALGGGMGGMEAVEVDPEEMEVEELEAALADPNTPPDVRAQIEAQLALAARRRLAGGAIQGGGL